MWVGKHEEDGACCFFVLGTLMVLTVLNMLAFSLLCDFRLSCVLMRSNNNNDYVIKSNTPDSRHRGDKGCCKRQFPSSSDEACSWYVCRSLNVFINQPGQKDGFVFLPLRSPTQRHGDLGLFIAGACFTLFEFFYNVFSLRSARAFHKCYLWFTWYLGRRG